MLELIEEEELIKQFVGDLARNLPTQIGDNSLDRRSFFAMRGKRRRAVSGLVKVLVTLYSAKR